MRIYLTLLFCWLGITTAKSQYYVTQYAGIAGGLVNGDTAAAKFNNPVGICVDKNGNMYITEAGNHTIRKIDVSGQVTTFAGAGIAGFQDGAAATARFNQPWGIAIDDTGNIMVSDFLNQRIRKITPGGQVITIAGTGIAGLKNGKADTAQLNYPRGMCFDKNGNLYIADSWNHSIRRLDKNGLLTVFSGNPSNIGVGSVGGWVDSIAAWAEFYTPTAIVYDTTDLFFVTDAYNHAIRKIDMSGKVVTLAGGKGSGPSGGDILNGNCDVAMLNTPTELLYDKANRWILFTEIGNQRIGKIDLNNCKVSSFAGNGVAGNINARADSATMNYPRGIVKRGSTYYFADFNNHQIRKVYFKSTAAVSQQTQTRLLVQWMDATTLKIFGASDSKVQVYNAIGQEITVGQTDDLVQIETNQKGLLLIHVVGAGNTTIYKTMQPF